jgi:hypothetical protein
MGPYLPLIAALLRREVVPAKRKRAIRQSQQTIQRARAADVPQVIEQSGFEFCGMAIGIDNRMVQLFPDDSRA